MQPVQGVRQMPIRQSALHSRKIPLRFSVAAFHAQRVMTYLNRWVAAISDGWTIASNRRVVQGERFLISPGGREGCRPRDISTRQLDFDAVGHLQGWRRTNHETKVGRRHVRAGGSRVRPFALGCFKRDATRSKRSRGDHPSTASESNNQSGPRGSDNIQDRASRP